MSPATNKKCAKCGLGFRGTLTPEEIYCAKCYVKTCEVPEDTDEEFLKLVRDTHGPEFVETNPKNVVLLPTIKDPLNHKTRLRKLEAIVEDSRSMKTKEKNRTKREIFRLREEQKEIGVLMESIKARMLHFALMYGNSGNSNNAKCVPTSQPPLVSTTKTPVTSALKRTPQPPSSANGTTPSVIVMSSNNDKSTTPPAVRRTPPGSPQTGKPPPSALKSPNASPVKLATAKFEEAAKKVNTVVTFAKLPAKKPAPPEVNNNNTPVTASSSSEDEEIDGDGSAGDKSALTRSNSVRDRIKVRKREHDMSL